MFDRLEIARDMIDPEFIRQLAENLRGGGGAALVVAGYSIPGLLDLYLEKLLFAAQEQGASAIALRFPHITVSEDTDNDTTRLHVDAAELDTEKILERVTVSVQEVMDELSLWQPLAEWTMSNLFVWTEDELAEEYGAAQFAMLSDEEFTDAFQARWAADDNIADKAAEALDIYAQEISQLFLEGARGVSSSQLGVLLGFPPELLSPAELETARRQVQAKLTEAFTAWEKIEQMQGDSPSVHARPRRRGRPPESHTYTRAERVEYSDKYLRLRYVDELSKKAAGDFLEPHYETIEKWQEFKDALPEFEQRYGPK